jgi:type I restriction enzyme S subunit
MATKYQAYSDYQKSDIEWSDVLPSHWGRVSLRWITVMYAGGTPSKNIEEYWEDGTVPWLNSGAVNQGLVTEASTFITEEAFKNSSAKWIPKGALVMALAGQGKTKGMVAQLGIDTTCNQSMAAVVPNDILDSRYIFWWLTSNYQNIRNMSGGDHRDGLNLELLGNIECPIPTHIEKQKIANFLDHETAKIDTLIEKQQQLIALLKEKRQAVISHAVTKGLNANAPMRDSGVEWLGEVPEHWVSCALKYYARIVDCKHITAEFFDEGIPLASIGEVKEWHVNLATAKLTNEKYYLDLIGGGRKPETGDIIYSRNATVGEAALVVKDMPDFAMGQDVCLIRLDEGVLPEYILYVLKSGVISNQLDLAMVGSTFKRINVDDIRNFVIALPSYEEQIDIVAELTRILGKYDALVINAESTVELLAERRTALISAAVTGKIDVRNWQAPETNHTSRKGISV